MTLVLRMRLSGSGSETQIACMSPMKRSNAGSRCAVICRSSPCVQSNRSMCGTELLRHIGMPPFAKPQPHHARKHLVAQRREILDVVDQTDRHAGEPGFAHPFERLGRVVVA